MDIAVVGLGSVGTRAARQLASTAGVTRLVLTDPRSDNLASVTEVLGEIAMSVPWDHTGAFPEAVGQCDAVVLAGPSYVHTDVARRLVAMGCHVVSVSDSVPAVTELLELDSAAKAAGVTVVAGAAFSPGLSGVLARHGASWFDQVDEIHVARTGTGGPACAQQHHRSFGGRAQEWRDGQWSWSASGSGRELCWFPDPVGSADCYRGALPEPILLGPAFPGLKRLSARLAGTRRDRLTARLPMLRRPHPEGDMGAVRVEIRGWRDGTSETVVLGAIDRPGVAAGAVAALAAVEACGGGLARSGAAGLAELVDPLPFLRELARRGVRAAIFTGTESVIVDA